MDLPVTLIPSQRVQVCTQEHIDAFKLREKVPALKERKSASLDTVPTFLNGRHLRDYQVSSDEHAAVRWAAAATTAASSSVLRNIETYSCLPHI